MKVVVIAIVVALVLLGTAVSGLSIGKSSRKELQKDAAFFTQLSLVQYVRTLQQAGDLEVQRAGQLSETTAQHIGYYKALAAAGSSFETVVNGEAGSVHDCVPFALQPALMFASAQEVREAEALYAKSKVRGAKNRSPCRDGDETVAIARPVIRGGSIGTPMVGVPKGKRPPQAAEAHARRVRTSGASSSPSGSNASTAPTPAPIPPLPPGYSYVDSPDQPVDPNVTTSAHTVLGVGPGVGIPLASSPFGDFLDHSINQLWWLHLGTEPKHLVSLETGWIQCAYFTFFPSTTLFAFSTPNGYGSGSANNYNTQGGFIQYPGAPPLANAVTEVLYMFQYSILPNNAGYALKLRPFHNSPESTEYVFEDWVPLGHYPMKRYTGIPVLNTFQTGQEIDQDANSTSLTASGKIFGWGTNAIRFPVKDNFKSYGQPMAFDYGNFPIFRNNTAEGNYTGANYVHFHGDDFASSSSSSASSTGEV